MEWRVLTTELGGQSIAGGKLKETGTEHWFYPNFGATDEVGFTALPAGSRTSRWGFYFLGEQCQWHTTNEWSESTMCHMHMHYNYESIVGVCNIEKGTGLTVRCVENYQ